MPLSPEFEDFYANWMAKAQTYPIDDTRNCFDKFFTLFVVYNRLYAEATFALARSGQININRRTSFPDGTAAKTYVLQYMTSTYLIQHIENNQELCENIEVIKDLIDQQQFNIKLHHVTGAAQRDKDLELLKKLNSRSTNQRAEAILDFLYTIRCNMFHARKGFQPVQRHLLIPAIIILKGVIEILHGKLINENG